jgi:putative AlgH/UPF0301 family transcriptional regulator
MLLILSTEPKQMITTDIGGPLKETKYFILAATCQRQNRNRKKLIRERNT